MKFVPHKYQTRCINFILDHPAAGLFLDMGLGKTVITLTAVQELLYERFEVSKVLVIAPKVVAEDTWSRETAKWDHLHDLRISKVLGSAKTRLGALEADADVYVINRENVAWLVKHYKESRIRWPFDMIVIDELSSFKSGSSQRWKALKKVRPMVDRIVGLTGTPAANGLMDLWAEIYLLDRGERLGQTITGYQRQYFRPGWSNNGIVYKWIPEPRALEAVTSRISDITVSMKAEDYLQLPDQVESTISVTMSAKALKAYREMERESLTRIEGEEITALTAAAAMSKLLQLANGFAYDEYHDAREIETPKVEALAELVEHADGPVLVFYEFQADRQRLLDAFPDARTMDEPDVIKKWNDGQTRMLLVHPASAGYGLNLQDGGHIIVWYGLPWSLEQYQQANARLHRQGQTKPVLIYHLLTAGTVDEQVEARLRQKDMTQNALLEVLKEREEEYVRE